MNLIKKGDIRQALYRLLLMVIILTPFFIYGWFQDKSKLERLEKCSKVTLISKVRIYRSNGMARMEFYYWVNNKKYQFIESMGAERSENGGWSIDLDKIKKQKILVRFGCKDANDYELLWDVTVPDTLTFVPINGWDKIPYGLDKYETKEKSW